MGDSEWCQECDAWPCECHEGFCWRCNDIDRRCRCEEDEEEEKGCVGGCGDCHCSDPDCPPDIDQVSTPTNLPPQMKPFEREQEIEKAIGGVWKDSPTARVAEQLHMEAKKLDEYDASIPSAIAQECAALRELLLRKNKAYGNSAFEPIGIFAGSDALALIATRADDKLSRIKNMGGMVHCLRDGAAADGEDAIQDLLGYLILARIAARRQ